MADRYLITNDDDELVFEDFDEFDEAIDYSEEDVFARKTTLSTKNVTKVHEDEDKSKRRITGEDFGEDFDDWDERCTFNGHRYPSESSAKGARQLSEESKRRYWDWVLWG